MPKVLRATSPQDASEQQPFGFDGANHHVQNQATSQQIKCCDGFWCDTVSQFVAVEPFPIIQTAFGFGLVKHLHECSGGARTDSAAVVLGKECLVICAEAFS